VLVNAEAVPISYRIGISGECHAVLHHACCFATWCAMLHHVMGCTMLHAAFCRLHAACGVLDALCCVFYYMLHLVLWQGPPVRASRRSSKRLACI
jgi:hypothetical protein